MRIVLASYASLPNSIGGGEVHVYELAQALKKLGHDPSILTVAKIGSSSVKVSETDFNGLRIHHLELPECRSIYDRDPQLTVWARTWLREQGVDVLHLFLINQLLGLVPAANELRIPVCLTGLEFSYFCRRYDLMYEGRECCPLDRRGLTCEQCVLSSYSNRQRSVAQAARILPSGIERGVRELVAKSVGDRLVTLGQRSISRQIERQRANFDQEIAAVIAPSTVMKNFYLAQGVDRAKLHFVPYGTNVQASENGHRSPQGILRVGYIGRMDPKKGVDVLCNAVKLLPPNVPVELKIFGPLDNGSSSYAEQIRTLADFEPRIKLLGKLEREKVGDAYREIDVLVVPSIWYENSPITISEALSHGCPVVCSDTDGMTDLIQDGVNGLTFLTGNSQALSHCLQRLWDEPELLANLRKRVRPVETTDETASQILRVYEGLNHSSPPVIHSEAASIAVTSL